MSATSGTFASRTMRGRAAAAASSLTVTRTMSAAGGGQLADLLQGGLGVAGAGAWSSTARAPARRRRSARCRSARCRVAAAARRWAGAAPVAREVNSWGSSWAASPGPGRRGARRPSRDGSRPPGPGIRASGCPSLRVRPLSSRNWPKVESPTRRAKYPPQTRRAGRPAPRDGQGNQRRPGTARP